MTIPTDIPSTGLAIACALGATDLEARLAEIAAVGRAALREARATPGRAVLRFAEGPSVLERVAAIAAAEARCCPFLALRVHEEPGAVVLTVEAPPDAGAVLDGLVAAFGPVPLR